MDLTPLSYIPRTERTNRMLRGYMAPYHAQRNRKSSRTMTHPRVFVIQRPTRREPSGEIVPTHDLTPATEWGEIVYLLRDGENPFRDPNGTVEVIRAALRHQHVCFDDYLLLLGSPILIAMVAVLVEHEVGGLRMLHWNARDHAYRLIEAGPFYAPAKAVDNS